MSATNLGTRTRMLLVPADQTRGGIVTAEHPPPGGPGAGGEEGSGNAGDDRPPLRSSLPRPGYSPPPPGSSPPPPGHSQPSGSSPSQGTPLPSAGAPPGAGLPGHIVALRPLTVGDTLDGIFQSLRASFGTLLGLVLLVVGPYQLLSGAAFDRLLPGFGAFDDPQSFEAFDTMFEDLIPALGWLAVLFVVGLLVSVIVAGALTAVAGAADRAQPISIGQALRISLERSGATVGASVLVLLAAVLTTLVLAIPLALLGLASPAVAIVLFVPIVLVVGLCGMVLSSLVIPIAIEEERGAWTTFVRAVSLLRRRFGYITGITMLVVLLLIAVTLGLGVVTLILTFVLGGIGWIGESIQAMLSTLVSAPVTALAAWVIHRDARVRLEAYDVVVRNQALGGGPTT